MTIQVDKKISFDNLNDLITTGIESGFYNWLAPTVKWNEKLWGDLKNSIEEGKLVLTNRNVIEDNEELIIKTITMADIKIALQLMADKYPTHFNDFIDETYDATTGDVFIQLLLLGDIVYG
jgi:hypothetical protein